MSSLAVVSKPSFTDTVLDLVERVDYRRADTPEQREAIYRLRYDAYRQEGAIEPNFSRRFSDPYDDAENAYIFGVYYDGELASSIRLTIATPECPHLPALGVFSDVLTPELEAGKTIIDPTRFVVEPTIARTLPKISYATVRLGWMACEYFSADWVLATVRVEHQAFYRRTFGHIVMSDARHYPSLTKPISLMGLDYVNAKDRVHQRYPFFRSTFFERRMLFERNFDRTQPSATVLRPDLAANA